MATENRGPFPRLFPKLVPVPASERKALAVQTKANLLPRGAYGPAYEFFSPDGGNTIIDISSLGHTSLAFVAYWYVATRWRAIKISEAPLMVVEEDQEDGSEEWLNDHELNEVLELPSQDYDMGELLERTSRYLDNGGECLWILDKDRLGITRRITPFKKGEFSTESDGERLYARFKVTTSRGDKRYAPEEVCYFRDSQSDDWRETTSRLNAAMAWLRLGEKSRQTIRELLENSVWPSGVIIPDKEWNPDPDTLAMYQQDIENYGAPGQKGRPFVQLGGGSFHQLAAKIRDLVPEEVLNRVESVVSAISGVPAIVLQFQVGMENSPWSQMAQARRMAYDDTIQPTWRKLERVLTRQLLRPMDEDTTHFVRFDRSNIESLKVDLQIAVATAVMMGRAASLNERRKIMGLEPSDDSKADDIPELTQPDPLSLIGGGGDEEEEEDEDEEDPSDDEAEDEAEDDEEDDEAKQEARRYAAFLERKRRPFGLQQVLKNESQAVWETITKQLLAQDREEIATLIRAYLPEDTGESKSLEVKKRAKDRVMTAIIGYLKDQSQPKWARATTPLLVRAAERSTAVIAADLGVNFNLVHPAVLKFAQKSAGKLVEGVSKTTRSAISDLITKGITDGQTTSQIADALVDSVGFSKERATLIARTETTRAFNGGPHDAMKAYAKSTGKNFQKTWSSALDGNVRDEHAAMEGETVPIDESFSNGEDYPSEPNCRCAALLSEVEE